MQTTHAVIHLRLPEPVVGRAAANDVLAGDVAPVVGQRGVEAIFNGYLGDVPRRHVGAGTEILFRGDLAVTSQELTNSSLMRYSRALPAVGKATTQYTVTDCWRAALVLLLECDPDDISSLSVLADRDGSSRMSYDQFDEPQSKTGRVIQRCLFCILF